MHKLYESLHSMRSLNVRSVVIAASVFGVVGGSGILLGCSDLTGSQPLPAGTASPSHYDTPSGAVGMRTAALYDLRNALPDYITDTGLLTDELESNTIGASSGIVLASSLTAQDQLNARLLPSENSVMSSSAYSDHDYNALQIVRADVDQALGAIAAYDTGSTVIGDPRVMRAELFALQGYTEILLADFFCSGVPLSTVDFKRDFTYHAPSSTAQVYQDALALEDSALALADTSPQVAYLASVLKGRTNLNLGRYAAAADDVSMVPTNFQYNISIAWVRPQGHPPDNILNGMATVADTEGRNGLPFFSSGDPRTSVHVQVPAHSIGGSPYTDLTFPDKYTVSGFSSIAIATGIEARLIAAEAAYQIGNPTAMIDTLNQLRATISLGALTDPGNDSARIALLFRERAYWLFLTGHRQGDLRRLLRQYPQWYHDQSQVYPTGAYAGLGAAAYGVDVTAPIPGQEYLNPLFHGCLNRDP